MKTKPHTSIFALVLTMITHSSAEAFTLTLGPLDQNNTGWEKSSITFDLDSSCSPYETQVREAVTAASDLWAEVPTAALEVSIGAITTLNNPITTYIGSGATAYAPEGNPIIYCDTAFSTTSGLSANSIPGFAGGMNIEASGKIVGGFLVLNAEAGGTANFTTLDSTLVKVILAHEIGHVLGLGHSADTNALMYYSTGPTRELALAKDDMDGISYLYPRSEPGTGGFFGCGTLNPISTKKIIGDSDQRKLPDAWMEFAALLLLCLIATNMKRSSIAVLLLTLITGCAKDLGVKHYSDRTVGEASKTYRGTVLNVTKVRVGPDELGKSKAGAIVGGVGGAVIGSRFGRGGGALAGTLIGAVAGAVGGAFAEKALKTQDALEYVVELDNKSLMSVVQGMDETFAKGERVLLMVGEKGRSRIVSANR